MVWTRVPEHFGSALGVSNFVATFTKLFEPRFVPPFGVPQRAGETVSRSFGCPCILNSN